MERQNIYKNKTECCILHRSMLLSKTTVFVTRTYCDDNMIIIVKYIFQFCNIPTLNIIKIFFHVLFIVFMTFCSIPVCTLSSVLEVKPLVY